MSQAKGSRGSSSSSRRAAPSSRTRSQAESAMTDVTPANASFPSKISQTPTKPEEADRIGRSSLARSQSSSSSGHSGSEALGTRTPSKTQGGGTHSTEWDTRARTAHTPGGKQSGMRKVNRVRDLKVKERARAPFSRGGEGTRGYVQTREAKVALPESGVLGGRF